MEFAITESSAVGEARRAVTDLSKELKFPEEWVGRAALIVAELATNLVKHAGRGYLRIQEFNDKDGQGIEIIAIDSGPGMVNVHRCLEDGYSTAGSAGQGLGAVLRAADYFDYYSQPGKGSVLLARLRSPGVSIDESRSVQIGYVARNYPGESECGDAWFLNEATDTLMVADGLGHGMSAAMASRTATNVFRDLATHDCVTVMQALHRALVSTRGAAIAIARFDRKAGTVRYVGIGNISGTVISVGKMRKMTSHNGIVGHHPVRIVEFAYPLDDPHPVVVMHSDGLSARWDINDYPGLWVHHSSVVASVLFRDQQRSNDDATIAVVRFV